MFCILVTKKNIKHLIVITGPTASGKTSLSIALAKHYKTCIVSADSRQFYKELEIGTAKPSKIEQDGIYHHFIDSHSLTDQVTSAQFEREALLVLEKEFQKNDFVILTGGSGMFIDALCNGLDKIPTSPKIKAEVLAEYEENGTIPLLEELKEKDPKYYAQIDQNNSVRIIRAIEVIRLTGKTFSSQRIVKPTPRPFQTHRFIINHDRETLYNRINQRVDIMMQNGLLDEVQSVHDLKHLSSLNTVGYKELFEFIENKVTLDEAVEKVKMNTRRYAKRQLTWFRRNTSAIWIKFSNTESMTSEIIIEIDRTTN